MDREYVTEEQRVRQRLKETLTPREKLANWLYYHKVHMAFAALALFGVLYFTAQDWGRAEPDYTVCWVSGQRLDEDTAEALSRRLAAYGEDRNGDGQVQVDIHPIHLDLGLVLDRGGGTEGQQEYGELLALQADLEVGQSGIFLTDDPAALQACTGALLYLDGSEPEEGASDWENMVISWEQEGLGTVYAGLRGCWKEGWAETWRDYRALWEKLRAR